METNWEDGTHLNATFLRLGVRETMLAAARSASDIQPPNSSSLQDPTQLEEILGPRRGDLYKVILLTVVYGIIFVTGMIGNICTCIVIARNRYMQTATNYYLFNLAVADLLVLIMGLPFETYTFWSAYPWVFGGAFCVVRGLASETATYASILTITAFTVERYVAICHPMRAQTMSSLSRAFKVIVCVWLLGSLSTIPVVSQLGLVYVKEETGRPILQSAICSVVPDKELEHAFEISTFLFFLAPMTIITVLYALIGMTVKRSTLARTGSDTSTQERRGSSIRVQQQMKARRAVLKMLVAVVVAFFVCWAPFHVQRLLVIYGGHQTMTPALLITHKVLFHTSGILYYVSSTINPILYNIMSLKFRQAFRRTIFRPCDKRRKSQQLATFKFYTKNGSDTHVSWSMGGARTGDGGRWQWRRIRRGLQCNRGFRHSLEPHQSSSSTSANSAARMLNEEHPVENNIVAAAVKSRSFHGIPVTESKGHSRPYHSYA